MPYNIWCNSCNEHIAKGRRFNAEKKQSGTYFSTKIWTFRMKCYNCSSYIEIETDPKNADYVVKSGARRKIEEWDPSDSGTIAIESGDTKEEENPFARIEHMKDDERLGELEIPKLERLYEIRDEKSEFDYMRNRIARQKFRQEKKYLEELEKEAKSRGLGIKLLPSSSEDEQISSLDFKLDKKNSNHTIESKTYYNKLKSKMKDTNFLSSKEQRSKRKLLEKSYKNGLDLSLFKKKRKMGET